MNSPLEDVALVREATQRLLSEAARLGDAGTAQPALLPGWTRGHVLAHLARNADALADVLAGRPMYPSEEARDADIERDAARPLATHLTDLRESAARLDDAFAACAAGDGGDGWERAVELRGDLRDRAGSLPFRRLAEVELHHIDLGAGYGLADLAPAFVEREIAVLAERFSGPAGLGARVELRAAEGEGRWRTGARDGAAVTVTGAPSALLGWLTGRRDGTDLSADGPLPVVPGL